jgi:hypothetical protein
MRDQLSCTRARTRLLTAAILSAVLAGCMQEQPRHADLPHDEGARVPKLDGPLGDARPGTPTSVLTETLYPPGPGKIDVASRVPLINGSSTSVTIDRIEMSPPTSNDAVPLCLIGARILSPTAPGEVRSVGRPRFASCKASVVPSGDRVISPNDVHTAEWLSVSIAPPRHHLDGARFARNEAVTIYYHDEAGTPYVMGVPWRFEYRLRKRSG